MQQLVRQSIQTPSRLIYLLALFALISAEQRTMFTKRLYLLAPAALAALVALLALLALLALDCFT